MDSSLFWRSFFQWFFLSLNLHTRYSLCGSCDATGQPILFLPRFRAIVIALTNENAQIARVGHQTARQTAESIAGTELIRRVATVSDGDSRPGHHGLR